MSWVSALFSSGIGEVAEGIGSLAKDLRSAFTGEIDPAKKAELEAKLMQLEHLGREAQVRVNTEEAKHRSVFVAGWRPFIGWVGGFSLLYTFIVAPLLTWCFIVFGVDTQSLPAINTEGLFSVVLAMLGMGTLRTMEKNKGVNHR